MKFLCTVVLSLGLLQHAAAGEQSDPVAMVADLYQEYAWEAVIDEPRLEGEFFFGPRSSLERYLTPELVDLVLEDRALSERMGEPGGLNFAPLWASQDPGATRLKVQAASSPDAVLVSFQYPGSDDQIEIIYKVEHTKAGWRISDIHYSQGDTLRQSLVVE